MIFYICIALYRALRDGVYCGREPGDAIGTRTAYRQYTVSMRQREYLADNLADSRRVQCMDLGPLAVEDRLAFSH